MNFYILTYFQNNGIIKSVIDFADVLRNGDKPISAERIKKEQQSLGFSVCL